MNVSQVDTMNPVRVLNTFGQSVWMDYIRRNFMTSGELRRVIVEEGISGVTSNPTIFEKAISGNSDYTEALSALRREPGLDAKARYERLAIEDIRTAADLLQPDHARLRRAQLADLGQLAGPEDDERDEQDEEDLGPAESAEQ